MRPRSDLEEYLAGLWREILVRETVGIHDNFHDFGVDSLQSAWFVNRVQAERQEPIFVVAVLEHPTVAEFAAFLTSETARWATLARKMGIKPD